MKTLTNIKGEQLIISPNFQDNTFEIQKNGVTWRTTEMTEDEFKSCLNNSGQDWQNYLNNSDDYYLV